MWNSNQHMYTWILHEKWEYCGFLYWKDKSGVPRWLSGLSFWLWLGLWSHGSWVWAPHQALCWQLRAWSLLQILCLPLSLPFPCLCSVSLSLSKINKILKNLGVPEWFNRLSVRLRLRSWSHGSWVRAPHWALCWQLGAWSLLRILCLPLSLSALPHTCSLSLSLSFKNKH